MTVPTPIAADNHRGSNVAFGAALVLAMAIAIILSPTLGALAPFLIDDLGITRGQIGLLTSAAALGSAATAPSIGSLVDRFTGRGLMSAIFGFSAAGLLAVAVAPTFALLAAAALVVGVTTSFANPASNRLIAAYADPSARGVIVGVKQSGVQVGALLAGAALPTLALAIGWRGAVLAVAGIAMLLSAAGWMAVPTARVTTSIPATAVGADDTPVVRARDFETTWLAVYAFIMAAATATVVSYLPLYSFDVVGYDVIRAGAVGATLASVGIVGRIAWAQYADRAGQPWRVLWWLGAGSALSQLVVILARQLPALVWIGAAGLGATIGAWHAVVQVTIVRRGLHGTGRRTGIVHLSFSAGIVAGPALFGISVDQFSTYTPGWVGLLTLNLIATALAIWWQTTRRPLAA